MKKKILNVGVISCSDMAQSHMLAVKNHEQACLAAVCDVDEEKLREAGDKMGVEARYTDYRELLRHPKELIDAGELGDIYYVESEYAHDYQDILSENGWRSDPSRNGVVGGGCHAVDLLRWVAGDPIEVTAYANHKMLPIVPYDDCTIAILRFENDVIGKVFVSTGCKRAYTMRSSFYGTKGTVVCDNTSPSITFYKSQEENPAELEEREIEVDIANHNTFGEFRAFADAILNDKPIPTDALQGAKTIAACMAIVDSANERRTIAPDYNFG